MAFSRRKQYDAESWIIKRATTAAVPAILRSMMTRTVNAPNVGAKVGF